MVKLKPYYWFSLVLDPKHRKVALVFAAGKGIPACTLR